MIATRAVSWANALFPRPLAPFAKLLTRKHKDKFKLDYEYFSNVPLSQREEELDRIKKMKNLKQQLIKDIPKFPNNEYWDYHGTQLMTYLWEPTCKPKAIVIFFHSLNGHIGMCGELARQLVGRGIVMAGYDYKNFGKSDGPNRGMLQSFDQLVSTSEQFVIKMKTKYPGTKIFMCGMSLGGAVAFHVSIKNPNLAQGNIFMSPSIRENNLHFPILKKMTILLSMAFPKVQLLKSKGRNASRYQLDEISKNDPYLYHGRLWVKTVQQILFAMGQTKKMYKQLTIPYLLVQSGCDKLVDPFACLDLQKLSPSKDKTTVIINDMWHAVWFDDHVYDVIKIIDEWLEERI